MTSPLSKPLALACALVLAFLSVSSPATAQPAARRVAVVLVNFADESIPDVPALKQKAFDYLVEAPDSISKYFAAQSHGQRTLTMAGGKVYGPVTVGVNAKCETKPLTDKALETLKAENVQYEDLIVVFAGEKANCSWAGLANVPGTWSWYPAQHFGLATLAHELGHNLGFGHQDREACPPGLLTGCTKDDYSRRSPMGAGGPKMGYTAPELIRVKWLAADKVITPAKTTTVNLAALHAPDSARGPRAVDLPLAGGDRLMVEYRAPGLGVDREIKQGVNVYVVPAGKYGSSRIIDGTPGTPAKADNSIPVGSSLVVGDISVTVLAAGATSAEVKVGIGPDAVTTTAKPSAPKSTTSSARPSSATASSTTSSSAPSSEPPGPDDIVMVDLEPAAAVVSDDAGDSQFPAYAVIAGAFVALLVGVLLVRRRRA
ncbi:hypothetical protein [Actinokineospora sp. HUAS TT18]|uniref:hypothetical protein n=1 Tax=Actinokineospora sp. HUAS TT18 TaxID=3447451 RepID=UPI003F520AF3